MSTTADELREEVRARYAESARAVTEGRSGDCGCGSGSCCADTESEASPFGEALYNAEQRGELPEAATLASLGCGNPTAVAELREGETVLDLGSGGGIDVILSARRVGPTGTAYGVDMTDEMLALARKNAADAGVANVHFLKGVIEQIPLPGRLRRRGDLELRDQPLGRQAGGADGDRPRRQAGREDRDQRRRRGGPTCRPTSVPSVAATSVASPAPLQGRVRGGARGGRLRAGLGHVHA